MTTKNEYNKYIKEILTNLSELISIPSVSEDKKEVTRALSYVLELGKKLGFETGSFSNGRVGVIEWGEGSETLGILAHVDVVPPDPIDQWETYPFEAVIKDGRITGRGTVDDKGMIIVCLYAMKIAADKAAEIGIIPKKRSN